ncbi:uncharacterized protein LOC141661580 [Apium graveolens]|uniref:uncharacterized protein LOC141661580 n=1 Tax=Apium graveolens TaxID=4045 RepID=UPI003D7A99E4
MACFGCYRRASNKNIEEDLVKTGSLTRMKKKNSFISWPSRLWTKKSDAKTVPVDLSMSGSFDPISKSCSVKLDNKDITSSKKYRLPIGVNAISSYKKRVGTVKEIILESREMNHLNSFAKKAKYDKKNSSRKKEAKKTRSISKSSSPPENINPSTVVTARVDQTCLPPQKKPKLLASRKNGNDIVSHENNESKEALDSNLMIGLSVIVVILVLILFLGKLYAILCTSAWFYMIPWLPTAVDCNVIVNTGLEDSNVPDLNSDEHKKRVVLEGLLQRNQRNVIRIL